MRKKLKDTGGLTFVELLCAVAILILLCLMMNTGLSMAVKSYQSITAESETQLLLSSLSDALADKLRYAVVTETWNTAGLPDPTLQSCKIFITKDSGIDTAHNNEVKTVTLNSSNQVEVDGKPLLPDGAYGTGEGAYIEKYIVKQAKDEHGAEVPLVTYDPGSHSFIIAFEVAEEKLNITQTSELTVRCLNVKKEETP